MTFVTRTISALRAIFLPMRLARHFSHVMRMRATGSIDVKFSAASEESARGVSCKSSRSTSPLFPASGLATGSVNGLHPKGQIPSKKFSNHHTPSYTINLS